mmetsp:Transcript_5355/g.14901  ORF Transcript_5355/g.14901 Transcript_5355/m.14901 type:complete len:637 (-) Transcript_5355:228-2138(-)
MVDYSKWEKLDVSSDEDGGREQRRPQPKRGMAPSGEKADKGQGSEGRSGGAGDGSGREGSLRDVLGNLPPERREALLALLAGEDDDSDVGLPTIAYHPQKSLHADLFDPEKWSQWVDPRLLDCLAAWRNCGKANASLVDLNSFEGCKVEAHGIISFPALNDEFCRLLLEEVANYRQSGLPSRAPNSMNNYGLVLNEIGMRPVFSRLLKEVFQPIGARLFGDDSDRVETVGGVAVGTENWGGSTLNDHHSFIVQYRPSDDKHLDMHIDECDVTFNFGITPHENFEGNDLTFCGMMYADNHRRYHHTYKHVKGRCVVHSGKRRHGALDIEKGERASLIMWTKSTSFRRKPEYRKVQSGGLNRGPADRVCLSYTHDPDYKKLTPKKLQYRMAPKQEGETDTLSVTSASTQAPPTEKRWVRVCADLELKEGKARMLDLRTENEQVAVFRHRGALFAIDNRCAHMGGPLCEADVEDLGASRQYTKGALEEDGVVRCPRHGMCFNIRTGENIEGGHMKQKVYPVRVSAAGDVEVEADLEVGTQPQPAHEKEGKQAEAQPAYHKDAATTAQAEQPQRPEVVQQKGPREANEKGIRTCQRMDTMASSLWRHLCQPQSSLALLCFSNLLCGWMLYRWRGRRHGLA